jgi:hypothetical protein
MIYLAGFPARLSVPPEKQITIACNGAGGRVGFEINAFRAGPLMRSVMLLDPSNLNGPCCSVAGIKIDFAGSLGQNDKGWRALGSGLGLDWTLGGAMGRSA